MKNAAMIAIASATLVLLTAEAGQATSIQCDGSTNEMLQCIYSKVEIEEKGIAESTKTILDILEANKKNGEADASVYDSAKAHLESSNKSFREFVQSQCAVEFILETPTGSLGRLVGASCVLGHVSQRNNDLKKLVARYK